MKTYLIYYTDKNDISEFFEAFGVEHLKKSIKWLHSDEIKASSIMIYKEGKEFDSNPDDIIEVYKNFWK